AVELAVVTGHRGDLARDRVRPRLQRVEQRRQVGTSLGQQLALLLQRVALGAKLSRQVQFADGDLLQIDGAVQQLVETARREDELEPPHAAERVDLPDVRLKRAQVLQVGELVMGEL